MSEILIPDEVIMSKIILIRNQKVIIDRDLAELYGITTKQLNQQVTRNINRFPTNFMIQLTNIEKEKGFTICEYHKKIKIFSNTSLCLF